MGCDKISVQSVRDKKTKYKVKYLQYISFSKNIVADFSKNIVADFSIEMPYFIRQKISYLLS